ncbi:hypothetical protein KBJ98_14950 [Flavobacterium sp. F-328]|jgi:hypothetical protein|uniref:Uncharacterized protein n=1 Tax=Flavobacterium erciyesense TaxID=2825842 RepID=A0ABS5D7N9_9FLAO|nr:hypothetical protein [Flavobacterium erciyesense]MBQ0910008.1 hypothetical protein [Flavobacterium erciyesense]
MNKKKILPIKEKVYNFYESKWFELVGVFALFAFIYFSSTETLDIEKSELIDLNVTSTEIFESSGRGELFKIKFKTYEYANSFGIVFGGTAGSRSEILESISPNNKIRVKILKENLEKLKDETEIVPIYYLGNKSRVIFDEFEFNEQQESHNKTVNIACFIVFILLVGRIILKE